MRVHEISGESEGAIISKMPLARVLDYQNRWLRDRGVILFKPNRKKGLKTVL